jgi:hypothetical protein
MAVALPTLAAVLAAHDDITTVPTPGISAYVADGSELLVAVVVTAILDRTAVIHPPGHDDDRRVVRLDAVFVHHAAVRWQPRSRHELRDRRAESVRRKQRFVSDVPVRVGPHPLA